MSKTNIYGACIERGEIVSAQVGRYSVKSYDRPGLITPPIGCANGVTVSMGDTVLFCLYDNGTGMILAALEMR